MSITVFQNARIVDPSRGIDEVGTVNIDGDSEPKMAGAIHIRCDGPAPEITIGSVLTIEAA